MRDSVRFKKTYPSYRQEPRFQGSACVICNTILNGEGPPASDLGLVDDLYLDTSNMELYGPKESNTGGWGTPIVLGGSGGSGSPGGLSAQIQFNDLNSFAGNPALTFNKTSETLNVKNISVDTDTLVTLDSKVGIGTSTPNYALEVVGEFAASVKSFVIDHPNKPGWKLRHGTLEGPENGVYVRGKSKEKNIKLPEYWKNLIDEDSITVHITPINTPSVIWVSSVTVDSFSVDCEKTDIEYFYTAKAQRKDFTFEIEYQE